MPRSFRLRAGTRLEAGTQPRLRSSPRTSASTTTRTVRTVPSAGSARTRTPRRGRPLTSYSSHSGWTIKRAPVRTMHPQGETTRWQMRAGTSTSMSRSPRARRRSSCTSPLSLKRAPWRWVALMSSNDGTNDGGPWRSMRRCERRIKMAAFVWVPEFTCPRRSVA